MEDMDKSRGMKFPPGINPATGRFLEASGNDSVKEAVYIILMTQQTERFTRQEFGSRLMSYPFMDTSKTRMHMMEQDIKSTLLTQEPRISDVEVQIEKKEREARMDILINYTLEEGGSRGDLLIPIVY